MKITSKIKAIRARCLECSETELDIKNCPFNGIDNEKCPLYPFRFGMTIQAATKKYGGELTMGGDEKPYQFELSDVDKYPSKAIRAKCLDCMGGSSNEVKLCVCNGHGREVGRSTLCPLYVFRFGRTPKAEDPQSGAKRLPTPGVEYA